MDAKIVDIAYTILKILEILVQTKKKRVSKTRLPWVLESRFQNAPTMGVGVAFPKRAYNGWKWAFRKRAYRGSEHP